MVKTCKNSHSVLAEVEKQLPYQFHAQKAVIRMLEVDKNMIHVFVEHPSSWSGYAIKPDGTLLQSRGGRVPVDGGIPPEMPGLFSPDAVKKARHIIQTKCR